MIRVSGKFQALNASSFFGSAIKWIALLFIFFF
jgi:hypothetical protein